MEICYFFTVFRASSQKISYH